MEIHHKALQNKHKRSPTRNHKWLHGVSFFLLVWCFFCSALLPFVISSPFSEMRAHTFPVGEKSMTENWWFWPRVSTDGRACGSGSVLCLPILILCECKPLRHFTLLIPSPCSPIKLEEKCVQEDLIAIYILAAPSRTCPGKCKFRSEMEILGKR